MKIPHHFKIIDIGVVFSYSNIFLAISNVQLWCARIAFLTAVFFTTSESIDIMRFFHNSSCISFHFHMKTLFVYYQYYKILSILIISRIIAIYIYCIISIYFVYVLLFFANKMQTMFTFDFKIIIKMPRLQRT